MSSNRTTDSINLVSRSMVFPMFRSKFDRLCLPRIRLFLCVVMLRLALGASEFVGEPIGRNNEKNSQIYAARKEHMNVALGSAGVLSGGRVSTDKLAKLRQFRRGCSNQNLCESKTSSFS